jgi:hypothetical protein
LSLCLTKHHAMKTYWGSGGTAPCILDLGTRWGWSAACPSCFTPRERAPSTHWIGSWVGPRAILGICACTPIYYSPWPYSQILLFMLITGTYHLLIWMYPCIYTVLFTLQRAGLYRFCRVKSHFKIQGKVKKQRHF